MTEKGGASTATARLSILLLLILFSVHQYIPLISSKGTTNLNTKNLNQKDHSTSTDNYTYKSRSQVVISYPDDGANTTTASSLSSSTTWHAIQNELCPNYNPNLQIARYLFPLAASVLNITSTSTRYGTNHQAKKNSLFSLFFPGVKGHASSDYGDAYYQSILSKEFYSGFFGFAGKEEHMFQHPNMSNVIIDYIPIWKCGNNQIRSFLIKKGYKKVPNYKKIFINRNSMNDVSCIITAIRDPITHFISGYNEIEYRWNQQPDMASNKPFSTHIQKEWKEQTFKGLLLSTRQDNNYSNGNDDNVLSSSLLSSCFLNMTLGSEERFEQFVKDVIDPITSKALYHWEYWHIMSMSRILPALQNKFQTKLTSYIPTLDDLKNSLPSFINTHCIGSSDNSDEKPLMFRPHNSSNDPYNTYNAATNVWRKQGLISQVLCIIHVMDYACWIDLPDGIPKLCHDIYTTNEHFVQTILNETYRNMYFE